MLHCTQRINNKIMEITMLYGTRTYNHQSEEFSQKRRKRRRLGQRNELVSAITNVPRKK